MDYKTKNPKIYNMFSFATPPDMISDGGVEANSLFGAMLHSKMNELHISTNKVVFVLNSARIANREIEIPHVKDNRIKDLLMANASDYFPVDLNQYELVHEIIGRTGEGDDKRIRLSVIAVPKEIIRAYELLAKSCGMNLVALDYTGNAIKQLMLKEIPGEIKVTVKVDETVSILTIIEGEEVKLQRMLNYGITEAVEEIQDSELFGEFLSFVDAMDLARRRTLMNLKFDASAEEDETPDLGDGADSEKLKNLKANVTYNLQTLVGSFARVLDYYQSRNTDKTIDKIFLIGMGADFSGLSKLMTNELNHKVVPLQQYEGVGFAKAANSTAVNVSEYFTCVGASLAPLPIISGEKKSKKAQKEEGGEGAASGESITIALVILALCCLGSIGLGGFAIFTNMAEQTKNSVLKANVEELSFAQDICDEYYSTKATYDWLANLNKNTTTYNDNLVAFLTEFEKKMPSQVQVLAFTAEEENVGFTIKVSKKEAVADVIEKFRTFDSITVGTVSTITEEEDDSGAKVVTFSIVCSYVDTTAETEATEAAETTETNE